MHSKIEYNRGIFLMEDLYQWIYDYYALPKLNDIETDYNNVVSAFSARVGLSKGESLRLHDLVSNMRLEWGAASFALGVKFGLRLCCAHTRSERPGWLMDFLP